MVHRPAWRCALVAGVAAVCRLGYWLLLTPDRVLKSDAAQYSFLAANLAHGKGYVDIYPQLALHATALAFGVGTLVADLGTRRARRAGAAVSLGRPAPRPRLRVRPGAWRRRP